MDVGVPAVVDFAASSSSSSSSSKFVCPDDDVVSAAVYVYYNSYPPPPKSHILDPSSSFSHRGIGVGDYYNVPRIWPSNSQNYGSYEGSVTSFSGNGGFLTSLYRDERNVGDSLESIDSQNQSSVPYHGLMNCSNVFPFEETNPSQRDGSYRTFLQNLGGNQCYDDGVPMNRTNSYLGRSGVPIRRVTDHDVNGGASSHFIPCQVQSMYGPQIAGDCLQQCIMEGCACSQNPMNRPYSDEGMLPQRGMHMDSSQLVQYKQALSGGNTLYNTRKGKMKAAEETETYGFENAYMPKEKCCELQSVSSCGNGSTDPMILQSMYTAEVQGNVYFMAKDQHGCQFLQKKFDNKRPDEPPVYERVFKKCKIVGDYCFIHKSQANVACEIIPERWSQHVNMAGFEDIHSNPPFEVNNNVVTDNESREIVINISEGNGFNDSSAPSEISRHGVMGDAITDNPVENTPPPTHQMCCSPTTSHPIASPQIILHMSPTIISGVPTASTNLAPSDCSMLLPSFCLLTGEVSPFVRESTRSGLPIPIRVRFLVSCVEKLNITTTLLTGIIAGIGVTFVIKSIFTAR